jgi:hypothetical protein
MMQGFTRYIYRITLIVKSEDTVTKIKLEISLLGFIDQFRKAYIGDQARTSSKVGIF